MNTDMGEAAEAIESSNGDEVLAIAEVYRSRESLCAAAGEASAGSPEDLRRLVYFYYIARYLVAVFESHHFELPIQVWNEYRNAFDHFMRHLSPATDPSDGNQIKKMELHIQRAVLDVAKLLCARYCDAIGQDVEHWGGDVLDLVGEGNFHADIRKELAAATDLLILAKTNDSNLGKYNWLDIQLINNFLDAVFKFAHIRRLLIDRHPALAHAKRSLDYIEAKATEARDMAIAEVKAEMRPKAVWLAVGLAIVGVIAGAIF